MNRNTIVLILALFTMPGAHAEMYKCLDDSGNFIFSDKPCQAPLPESTSENQSFQANVLIVGSHSEIEDWVKLDSDKRQGDVGRARNIKRGVKIYLPIIATFTESQAGKKVALVADFEIVSPKGRVHKIPGCCIANRADPRAPETIVLIPVVDVTFDVTDENGEYKVKASIHSGKETFAAEESFYIQ